MVEWWLIQPLFGFRGLKKLFPQKQYQLVGDKCWMQQGNQFQQIVVDNRRLGSQSASEIFCKPLHESLFISIWSITLNSIRKINSHKSDNTCKTNKQPTCERRERNRTLANDILHLSNNAKRLHNNRYHCWMLMVKVIRLHLNGKIGLAPPIYRISLQWQTV